MALRSADQAPSVGEKSFDGVLDKIHQLVVNVDKAINKVIPEEFNPFYYLGGITNILWVLLVPTGIFLWFYYEPTTSKAFISVDYLTNYYIRPDGTPYGVPFGNVIRAIHRYAGDGMILMAILHMLRNLFTDRYRGFRDLPWVSGVVMLLMTGLIGLTGYLLVWDQRAIVITDGVVKMLKSLDLVIGGFGTYLARALIAGDEPNNLTLARMFFLHAGPAVLMFFVLWVHYLRLHRPKIWPPAFVTLMTIGLVVLISGLAPVEKTLAASVPITAESAGQIVYDVFYLWPILLLSSFSPAVILSLLTLIFAGLMFLPWAPAKKHRYINAAVVIPENCTGCQLCAVDCPFDAIVMVDGMNPNPRNKQLAVVNDDKCAECGICVGACPFHAINLPLADEKFVSDRIAALLQ